MNTKEIILTLPLGFQVKEKTEKVDLYSAYEILRSRKQRHITKAERFGDYAILTSHTLKCPHCGRETPAYSYYWNDLSRASPKKSNLELFNWADIQPSMYKNKSKILIVQENKVDYPTIYICKYCGLGSQKSNECIDVLVEQTENTLCLKREIKNLKNALELKWADYVSSLQFPLYEKIIFNFETGNTLLEIATENKVYETKIVTFCNLDFTDDRLVELINKNQIIKRTLKRLFVEKTNFQIPFFIKELNFKLFNHLIYFNGFKETFYDKIPNKLEEKSVYQSFNYIIKRLRTPEMAMKALKESSLPNTEKIKTLFTRKNGLFFYLKECEELYKYLGNEDYLYKFLNSYNAYNYLSIRHFYNLEPFFKDYIAGNYKMSLWYLFENYHDIVEYAISYSSLTDEGRQFEQENWNNIDEVLSSENNSFVDNKILASVSLIPERIKDCNIGKYSFRWLRTVEDFFLAGSDLDDERLMINNRGLVVSINLDKRTVAAIRIGWKEIDDERKYMVIAGTERGYRKIKPYSDIYRAIEIWCNKNDVDLPLCFCKENFF